MVFNIHTDGELERRKIFLKLMESLKLTKVVIIHGDNIFKNQLNDIDKLGISKFHHSEVGKISENYDTCILYNLIKPIDIETSTILNMNNKILMSSHRYYSPSFLSNKLGILTSEIKSFEGYGNGNFFTMGNSKFDSIDSTQLITFITREIKLGNLLNKENKK